MNKKIVVILFMVFAIFVLAGCGNSTSKNSEPAKENNSTMLYALNEENLIEKPDGNYTITFKGAHYPTAEWSKTHVDHKVIFFDYAYSNISYQKKDGTTLFIPHEAFIVTNQDGVILNSSYMYDESRKPLTAPPGTICEASLPYIINSDVTEINVKFLNGTTGEVVGEISLPVSAAV